MCVCVRVCVRLCACMCVDASGECESVRRAYLAGLLELIHDPRHHPERRDEREARGRPCPWPGERLGLPQPGRDARACAAPRLGPLWRPSGRRAARGTQAGSSCCVCGRFEAHILCFWPPVVAKSEDTSSMPIIGDASSPAKTPADRGGPFLCTYTCADVIVREVILRDSHLFGAFLPGVDMVRRVSSI